MLTDEQRTKLGTIPSNPMSMVQMGAQMMPQIMADKDMQQMVSVTKKEFVDHYGTSVDTVRMNVSAGVLIALLHGAHPADVQQKDVDAAMSFSFSIADRFISELTRRPLMKDPI